MKYPNIESSNKSKQEAKVISLKVLSKNIPLEYLLLSFEKINKNIEEHLQKYDYPNSKTYE